MSKPLADLYLEISCAAISKVKLMVQAQTSAPRRRANNTKSQNIALIYSRKKLDKPFQSIISESKLNISYEEEPDESHFLKGRTNEDKIALRTANSVLWHAENKCSREKGADGRWISSLERIENIARHAADTGVANCGEQTAMATCLLLEKEKYKSLKIPLRTLCLSPKGGDHAFVALGLDEDCDINDMLTWGKNAVLCDPWGNMAVKVQQELNKNPKDRHVMFNYIYSRQHNIEPTFGGFVSTVGAGHSKRFKQKKRKLFQSYNDYKLKPDDENLNYLKAYYASTQLDKKSMLNYLCDAWQGSFSGWLDSAIYILNNYIQMCMDDDPSEIIEIDDLVSELITQGQNIYQADDYKSELLITCLEARGQNKEHVIDAIESLLKANNEYKSDDALFLYKMLLVEHDSSVEQYSQADLVTSLLSMAITEKNSELAIKILEQYKVPNKKLINYSLQLPNDIKKNISDYCKKKFKDKDYQTVKCLMCLGIAELMDYQDWYKVIKDKSPESRDFYTFLLNKEHLNGGEFKTLNENYQIDMINYWSDTGEESLLNQMIEPLTIDNNVLTYALFASTRMSNANLIKNFCTKLNLDDLKFDRQCLLKYAAENSDTWLVKILLPDCNFDRDELTNDFIYDVAQDNNTDLVNHIYTKIKSENKSLLQSALLLCAAKYDIQWLVEKLLSEYKFSTDEINMAFIAAVENKNTDVVNCFLNKKELLEQDDLLEGLFSAIEFGFIDLVRVILVKIDDINKSDDYDDTALDKAILYDEPKIADLLIKSGAQLNDKKKYDQLNCALNACEVKLVTLLLDQGIRVMTPKDVVTYLPVLCAVAKCSIDARLCLSVITTYLRYTFDPAKHKSNGVGFFGSKCPSTIYKIANILKTFEKDSQDESKNITVLTQCLTTLQESINAVSPRRKANIHELYRTSEKHLISILEHVEDIRSANSNNNNIQSFSHRN